jgi:hypothetical protein
MCIKDFEGCSRCGHGELDYEGEAGAPGVGSFWRCPKCGTSYHKRYGRFTLMEQVDPLDLVLQPWQVQ